MKIAIPTAVNSSSASAQIAFTPHTTTSVGYIVGARTSRVRDKILGDDRDPGRPHRGVRVPVPYGHWRSRIRDKITVEVGASPRPPREVVDEHKAGGYLISYVLNVIMTNNIELTTMCIIIIDKFSLLNKQMPVWWTIR